MQDQYTPPVASKEVRELRRALFEAQQTIDQHHDQIRDMQTDLCMAQPRQPRPLTIRAFVALRLAEMPNVPIEDQATMLGTSVATVQRLTESIASPDHPVRVKE